MVNRNFGRVNEFILGIGSSHVSGVVWDSLIVDDGLGGSGELGEIALLAIILIHDKSQHIVDSLIRIVS